MMGKVSFLAGAAVGYVFGTRAGEKRYEQIKKQADKAWQNPAVQEKVTAATEQVKTKAPAVAAAVGQKAADAGKNAGQAAAAKAGDAKDAVANRGDKDLPETIHRGEDGELHADTSGFGPGGEKLP
ncbi:YtxH domain-containing protein [Dermacoccus barathri]|uniref:YtxH domain-containing protein n=1 Tax=Dermacoccus abyssi TaxID=322596 RepID=A0ABX5Z6M9_9MICO|nr:YtxH domain-containing protein [Dermacoccus barathri]MBE7370501.1 YtxH domain-containing protein [Dermacoccus barathri]QEH92378.1 YtxH domain-containing protein [Dermacoccus abyssi]